MAVNFGVAVVHGSILPFLFACFWGVSPPFVKNHNSVHFKITQSILDTFPLKRPQNLQRHPNRSLSLVFVLYIVHMVLKSKSYLSVKRW